jgi:hypothetical protein
VRTGDVRGAEDPAAIYMSGDELVEYLTQLCLRVNMR